jgi:antitoxin VapB
MEHLDSKVFRSGNSEAVRIPKSLAFGADIDVTVSRIGESLWIRPKGKRPSLAEMAAKLHAMGPVTEVEARVPFDFPERRGL